MQTQERPIFGPDSPGDGRRLHPYQLERVSAALTRRERLDMGLERLHSLFLEMVQKRIDLQDEIDGDPDFEPFLGAKEHPAHLQLCPAEYFLWTDGQHDDREAEETDREMGGIGDRPSQLMWSSEGGPEGDGEPDDEATLSAALDIYGRHDQRQTWNPLHARRQMVAGVEVDDAEHDGGEEAEEGGDLGWSEGESLVGKLTHQSGENELSLGGLGVIDQRRWASGGGEGHMHRDMEGEMQCEDEGHDSDTEATNEDGADSE